MYQNVAELLEYMLVIADNIWYVNIQHIHTCHSSPYILANWDYQMIVSVHLIITGEIK